MVCEDVWVSDGPAVAAARAGAGLVISINASPFHAGKQIVRDMWRQKDVATTDGSYEATVNPHGVVFVKILPAK